MGLSLCLSEALFDGVDHLLDLVLGDAVEERQAQQALALLGGVLILPVEPTQLEPGGRAVQGHVVEGGEDAPLLELADEGAAVLPLSARGLRPSR